MSKTRSIVHTASRASNMPNISMLTVVRHLLRLHIQMKQQEQYCKEQIPVLIAAIIPPEQFSFSSKDIQRITKYYQLALNLVCDNLYLLTGHRLSEQEKKSILLLSIFAPLFDNLFDEQILEYNKIEELILHPESYTPAHITDLIVHRLYLQVLEQLPERQAFIQSLQEVGHWEQESLKQFNKDIGEEELTSITYNKSYYSILLFCAVLKQSPGKEIESILYPVSGLMQLTNDVFDVWKDTQQGLHTIPTLFRNYEKLENIFLEEISAINHQVSLLAYPEKNRRNFLIRVHALHAMGWISLQQLKVVAAGKPLIELSRKELVCDMDNWRQQLKWLKAVRRLCNYKNGNASIQ
jgi:hypothetical protein